MRNCFYILAACMLLFGCNNASVIEKGFLHAEKQLTIALEKADSVIAESWPKGDTLVSPRTFEKGRFKMLKAKAWTSGFFPGSLWYMYEYTGKEEWKQAAVRFQSYIEDQKKNVMTHDTGFKINCSFGNGYRLTGDPAYRDVLIESAYTLATRFNPNVGCTLSWSNTKRWTFPVIIDNMMNLELLFVAARETGDKYLYDMAVSHARTTMKNHFREDYSCWHVLDYDPQTGEVVARNTHQGYSDESTWSRGEAWALYGFTMCYRETSLQEFLDQSRNIARYILDSPTLPEDMIPYWDFDCPEIPDTPRDVSAGAVMASAFYELCTLDPENAEEYKAAADTMVKSMYEIYRHGPGNKYGFVLDHSTGAKTFEIDVPLIYADYYFLEALMRKMKLENK
jgi:hypothetical protein